MSHPRMKKLLMLALAGILSSSCFANVESVQNNLKQHYPNLKFEQIQTTEMNGIYSAVLDGQVVYVGEEANHILVGSMIRLKDQQNLTIVLTGNSCLYRMRLKQCGAAASVNLPFFLTQIVHIAKSLRLSLPNLIM